MVPITAQLAPLPRHARGLRVILPSPSPSLLLPSSDLSDLVRAKCPHWFGESSKMNSSRAGSLGKGGLGGIGRQVGRDGIYVT